MINTHCYSAQWGAEFGPADNACITFTRDSRLGKPSLHSLLRCHSGQILMTANYLETHSHRVQRFLAGKKPGSSRRHLNMSEGHAWDP